MNAIVPGEIVHGEGEIDLFPGRAVIELDVVNTGDRPVQVGSHYHFAEVNPALQFDRATAYGMRLAIPAGTSVRFEPGIDQTIRLVAIAGDRIVPGLRGAVGGHLDRR